MRLLSNKAIQLEIHADCAKTPTFSVAGSVSCMIIIIRISIITVVIIGISYFARISYILALVLILCLGFFGEVVTGGESMPDNGITLMETKFTRLNLWLVWR
jgi:hypothetical protein